MPRIITVTFILILFSHSAFCQNDTLLLNKKECEAIFLKNNLFLLVEQLEISKVEAEIIQAKVWPNPTLTIEDVNLWRPKSIQGEEVIPPVSGDFGRNQQFAIGLEQLIITAGKRKKFIALKEVEAAQSSYYFEEILRNLKVEFRSLLSQLNYLQNYYTVYQNQLTSIQQLLNSYKNQVDKGFLSKGEYIRLKASAMSIQNEMIQLENEIEVVSYELKLLMNLPSTTHIQLSEEGMSVNTAELIDLEITSLLDIAFKNRPEHELSKLGEVYADKLVAFEKAERSPDIAIQGKYNRGDGPYTNFIGFGVALDLPLFNRNKGGIRRAQLEQQQAQLQQQYTTNSIEKEVNLALVRFRKALEFTQQIDPNYETELDQILASYTENFKNRNVSLLEYLDFLEAYLENKNLLLNAVSDLRNKAEELNFAIGKDYIK